MGRKDALESLQNFLVIGNRLFIFSNECLNPFVVIYSLLLNRQASCLLSKLSPYHLHTLAELLNGRCLINPFLYRTELAVSACERVLVINVCDVVVKLLMDLV